ncbi:hypothetical protein [Macrococcoides canis]|uniref:Uncharacterized protein n=1 Tax=Macrococcoides canis TaxID=1855823 RepID=A0A4R6C1P8_9STAP|nr:hypothetical protein [Macrococcus]TDM15169.1 hypothetical protein ETI04_10700 [Macrococcus canis]TDM29322.1 hypothetical protein ETI03_10905 [Macrococcus canis]TDM31986.1 hypothetical protein ETI13_10680 [Macrococcus canis]TDM38951.1 hypothetical protein ETI10_12805 [Macrococcus goetzii]TDM39928.1 hypothetical protein ETI09_10585 [Macrococcus canis]
MEIRNVVAENKMEEFNSRFKKLNDMEYTDRINFLKEQGLKYTFEYVYDVKCNNSSIIINSNDFIRISYYYMFFSNNNFIHFYRTINKGEGDIFWINNSLILLKPIIEEHLSGKDELKRIFQDINHDMKEKNSEYLDIAIQNKMLKGIPESTSKSLITSLKHMLEKLSLFERDSLSYIKNNDIDLISLFTDDKEKYELELYGFYNRLSKIDNRTLIDFFNNFAVNKFKENEIIEEMSINSIKRKIFGDL